MFDMPLHLSGSLRLQYESRFFPPLPTNVYLIIVLIPSASIWTFVSTLGFVDMVGDWMGENQILQEFYEKEGKLDEVEVDIVEDQIGEKACDNIGEGREGKMGERPMCGGALTVKTQSQRIHAVSPPTPGVNELKPSTL